MTIPAELKRFAVFILTTACLVAACGPADRAGRAPDGAVNAVATTSMIADLLRQIGAEHVEVTGLMGPGVDPHLYQASAGDVTRMSEADVIFYNGLHLEGKMVNVFEQMHRRNIRAVAVAETAVPDDELIESPAFQGNYDPHVWFDVSLWMQVAETVHDVLAEMDPENATNFQTNLQAYRDELSSLDAYIREKTAELTESRRVLITSHDAFGYFGRAYGFEVYGLQGISTAAEAGTADVQALVELVVQRRIPALFIESSVSPKGIEAVREAVRSRGFDVSIGGTLYGDALGNPETPAGTYAGMIRHNIDTIVSSLQGNHVAAVR
jgi:manganese/zinc/iron transport system substrate-binding protein